MPFTAVIERQTSPANRIPRCFSAPDPATLPGYMDRSFHTASAGHNLQFVPPMLLGRVPQLPEGPEWQYEVKWDGYQMQAIEREAAKTNRTKATLMSPQLVTCTETTFCYRVVVLRCRTCVRRAG